MEDRLPAHLPKRDNFKYKGKQGQQVRKIVYDLLLELLTNVFKSYKMVMKVFNTTTTKFLDETAPDSMFCLPEAGTAQM